MSHNLCTVSNADLVSRLKTLTKRERECTHEIILHLQELGRRRLYADLGYSSLFDYAVRALGYSPAAAQRRIKASRVIDRVPEAYSCLEKGTLSLAVLEVVSDALTSRNAREIVRDVVGKSRDEAREVVAMYHPVAESKLREKIEPVFVQKNTSLRAEACNFVGNDAATGGLEYQVSFVASPEMKEKLERAREIAGGGLGDVLEKAVEEYLERHCPARRHARREKKRLARDRAQAEQILESIDEVQEAAEKIVAEIPDTQRDAARSRYISRALRDEVLARDGHRCSYVAEDGTRCQCRVGLEIDHEFPFGLGGRTDLENLRTMCKAHNFMFARRMYGDWYIDECVKAKSNAREIGDRRWVREAEQMLLEI